MAFVSFGSLKAHALEQMPADSQRLR